MPNGVGAALGFGWLMWRRARFAYAAALVSAVLTYAIGQTSLAPYSLAFGSVYFSLAAFGLLATLSFADATDLAALASGYPRHLFLLPVRSATLAAWPMLLGSLTLATAWVAFAAVALAPVYGPLAVAMPALGLVALLAGLQAAAWVPVPLPFLRTALVLVTVGALVAWGSLIILADAPPLLVGAGYAVATATAFTTATWGLGKARRGEAVERSWPTLSRRARAGNSRPFRSPMEAQLWLENRRDGLGFTVASAFMALLYQLPLLLVDGQTPASFGALGYDPVLGVYLLSPLLAVLMSGFDGGCASVRDNFRPDFSLAPLLAARPMSDAALVESKLRMAAWSVLRGGAILAIGPLLLLMSRITFEGAPTTVGAYLAGHAGPRGAGLIVLGIALFGLLAWRGIVSAMWLRLSHRTWLRNGAGIALPALFMFGVPYLWLRVRNDPGLLPVLAHWVLPALAALAALKLLAALLAARRLRVLDLVPARTMVRWGAAVLALGVGLHLSLWLLPPVRPFPPAELALVVFLLLPLLRVQLAVLVMHDNRHRG